LSCTKGNFSVYSDSDQIERSMQETLRATEISLGIRTRVELE
jgi:hypothetical protein